MSKIILGIVAGLVLGSAVTWSILRHGEAENPKEKDKAHGEESHVVRTNGHSFIKLDKESQEHAGLKLAELAAGSLQPEVKAYGRVLDPTPLAALLIESASSQSALEASTKEFERLKVLHAQDQNVSTRALEAAEAIVKRDHILVEAAQLKLIAGWGTGIASQPDLPAFVRSLAALETALARLDLPLGEALKTPPVGARIAAVGAPDSPVDAEFLGPITSADPQTQAQGFMFVIRKNPLPPGAAVIGWLVVPGETQRGVVVPRSAIVRHEGEAFIFLQMGDDRFERQEVELEHPLESGWFVETSLKPGQKVVVVGAQQLLSEELKGSGGGE